MKPLELNFSRQPMRKRRRRDWSVLVLSLLLLVFVGREAATLRQHQLKQVVVELEQNRIVQLAAPGDPEKRKLAQSMADSLNLPWYELLEALESVKKQHPEVYLKAVLPDAGKQQVVISGEVKRLGLLLAYIDTLNQHTLFTEVLPVSQQQIVPVSNGMAFTLKLEWRHE